MRRGLIRAIAACALLAGLGSSVARRTWRVSSANAAGTGDARPPLALAQSAERTTNLGKVLPHGEPPQELERVALAGLDLTRIDFEDHASTAPVDGGTARLTLDADLQRTAAALMATWHLPEAAVVLMDVASGRLLVYASHVEHGPMRDLCAEATAPSASIFKIITAASLVEDAHLGPDTKQCYSGGEEHIGAGDLVDDPQRDRWCATLASALGRSVNAVFARLAKGYLAPVQLEAMARRFGYGEPLPFDVPVQPSEVNIPSDPLELARTAAGFWNTTLSPLQAAQISAIVARGGESVRPRVVDKVVGNSGAVLWSAPETVESRRCIAQDTAEKLETMMEHTVSEGTSWRAFHDARGIAFLPGLGVAGKTGTLTNGHTRRYYTWFTGFAPTKALSGVGQVALSVLVVNGPIWRIKANALARDVLRAYFASHEVRGVTRPTGTAVARRTQKR
jgi:cell division protein FtsI/penicillin-binding protein 2